jgi:unsaturated rhamnogalacturonyl hydrolase
VKTRRLPASLLLLVAGVCAGATPAQFGGATPLEWSVRMARSEMARRGGSLDCGWDPKARWDYTTGIFADALQRLSEETGNGDFKGIAARVLESFVASDGTIRTYKADDLSLDNVESGRALLALYGQTREERLGKAVRLLRAQLTRQPRTAPGIFWHKLRYPHQVWLDGLYMGQPFYAAYGRVLGEPGTLDDASGQVIAADRILYEPQTGLYYHGWDESRRQPWADPGTGLSPCFWSRSIGWYAMAVADMIGILPASHASGAALREIAGRASRGLVRWQDPASGVWWQVTDQGSRKGNYLESSGSSMFVYAMAKGVNEGYLPRVEFEPAVARGYAGIIREFVRVAPGGGFGLARCCEVASLGSVTGADGRPRSGSFAYYVAQPVVDNDLKGVAPFIMAGIEVNRMLVSASGSAPTPSPK